MLEVRMSDITDQTTKKVDRGHWSNELVWAGGDGAATAASREASRSPDRLASGLPFYFEGQWPDIPAQTTSRLVSLAAKRVMDLVLASAALLVLLPLLIGIAVAIALTSRGPIFFRQERPGQGGRPFVMYKFRTMRDEACDTTGIAQTTVGDSRLTPLGGFLRAKSLDELPQLINVLKGDMSIIGPRPHVQGMLAAGVPYEELVPYYEMRLLMRPGLSGWAQANGLRGPTILREPSVARVDHDIAYIQNFSLTLDARIIWMTIAGEFLTGSGL
jgi:lipopolysaccharide/colanic/teichoic acid biosynthesis glycosyltransferase